jgi:CubicO group peptidase (beta-lactamase class C family)
MQWIIRAFVIWIALASVAARADQTASCGSPPDLYDGWSVAAPEQEGLDPALICGIGPRLDGWEEANPHAVVVARHGALVYEHYFTGEDWRLSMPLGVITFDAATKHDMRSISKSVTSLLVGIAFDRGWLTDLDAPVLSFFPEYESLRTPEKDRITLRHVLTMSSGLAWDETSVPYTDPSNSWWQMDVAPDSHRYVLERPLAAQPGEVFNYDSGSADLLGLILRKASGRRLDALAKEALFDPLEIDDWDWDDTAGFNPSAAAGLRLRPRDLAKIGQLVLQHGAWHGRQIVSSAWIDQSIIPRMTGTGLMFNGREGITSFGYLWWLGHVTDDRPEHNLVTASGYGGQRLFIVPSLDLVVVSTAGVYGGKSSGLTGVTALNDFVLPAAAAVAH